MNRTRTGMISALAGTLALSGCGDATGPAVRVRIDATAQQLQDTRVMIEDARIRVLSALESLTGAPALGSAIDGLAAGVDAHDAKAVERNAQAALDALEQMRSAATDADQPDLTVIDLTIMAAAEILEHSDGSRGNLHLRDR